MLTGAVAVVALGSAAMVVAAPELYAVEPALTSAEFAVSHLGISRQRGHFGETRGTIVLDPEHHAGEIEISVDATSIDTGWRARDAFLRGENMFDTAHYPTVHFRSTQLVFAGERLIGVAGELTMRNVTRMVALKVERLECDRAAAGGGEVCDVGAATSLKRSDFGMNYAPGLVGDDIDLWIQVTAFRVPPRSEPEWSP